jgi:hypothetical protein
MQRAGVDKILDFDFTVTHIPGILSVLPDCLSRLYALDGAQGLTTLALACFPFPSVPDGASIATPGLPVPLWGDYEAIPPQPDWLPQVPLWLGGGCMSPTVDVDTDYVMVYRPLST